VGVHISASINASPAENEYSFTLTAASSEVIVYESTGDWKTEQDLYVSTVGQPVCSGVQPARPVFSNVNDTNNQTVYVPGSYLAGTYFYVTVCNRSGTTGKYSIYWSTN
jgi:hypothetical protein